MGRKFDMKKIEHVTKCQVTFSKRRSSLIKKARDIAICCDVDVAFVAFSPSGRVSKYCNQRRIEDVLHRYVELPSEMRLPHIENVERKLNRLKQLSNFKSDISKLHYLDKQIENFELQIKKCGLELQLLEADLRDYEVAPDQEPASLHQLSWCERNLNHSLEKVIARKNEFAKMSASSKQPIEMQMVNQSGMPFPSNFNENRLASNMQNPAIGGVLMKLDPWMNPYSANVRENLFKELLEANTATPNMNPGPSNICNFPFPDASTILESGIPITFDDQMPVQQAPVVELPKLPDQINADVWNDFSSMAFPDEILMSSQTLCNLQAPRFASATTDTNNGCTTEMSQAMYNEIMDSCLQFPNSNLNQLNNLRGGEAMGHLNMNFGNTFNNINSANERTDVEGSRGIDCGQLQRSEAMGHLNMNFGNTSNNINSANERTDVEGSRGIDCGQLQMNDQIQQITYSQTQTQNNFYHDTPFNNLPPQDVSGQEMFWTSKIQKSGSWNWEDLLLDDNFNCGDF